MSVRVTASSVKDCNRPIPVIQSLVIEGFKKALRRFELWLAPCRGQNWNLLDESANRGAQCGTAGRRVVLVPACRNGDKATRERRGAVKRLPHLEGNNLIGGAVDVQHGEPELTYLGDGIKALGKKRLHGEHGGARGELGTGADGSKPA